MEAPTLVASTVPSVWVGRRVSGVAGIASLWALPWCSRSLIAAGSHFDVRLILLASLLLHGLIVELGLGLRITVGRGGGQVVSASEGAGIVRDSLVLLLETAG